MTILLGGPFAREGATRWSLRGTTLRGGPSLTGFEQVVRIGSDHWEAELSNLHINDADAIRYWRAIEALLEGGAAAAILPACESVTAPWPVIDGQTIYSYGDIAHDDETFFDDGAGYYQQVILVETAAAAARGATSLTLSVIVGSALIAGQAFSIEHSETVSHRRYHIRTAMQNDDGTWAVTIRPGLREAVQSGVSLDFDRPKCLMRLAEAEGMDASFDLRKFARPTVRFVEVSAPVIAANAILQEDGSYILLEDA